MKRSSEQSGAVSSRSPGNSPRPKSFPAYVNDDAQAAVIFLFIVGLIACLALWIWLSPTMDQFTTFHNAATQGASAFLPISQDRQDAIFLLQVAFGDYPLIAFVIITIAAVVAALKWRTSPV